MVKIKNKKEVISNNSINQPKKVTLDNLSQIMSLANNNVNFESRYNLLYESPNDAYLLYNIRNFKNKNCKDKVFEDVLKTFKFNVNFKETDFFENSDFE